MQIYKKCFQNCLFADDNKSSATCGNFELYKIL